MNRKSLVLINYRDYILGFAHNYCCFDGRVRFMGEEPGEGKLNLTQMSGGEVRRLEIDNLDACLAVYDDAEYRVCLSFQDVSYRWQNYIINNCPQIKKLPFIRELIDKIIVDLRKTGENMLKIGKNFTYSVLQDYSREYEKCYPEMIGNDLETLRDRFNELVELYLDECTKRVETKEDVQKLIEFVDTIYYRAEGVVGEARDTYLDQKVERDIVNGAAKYRFIDETFDMDKNKGAKLKYNQKQIYDYAENMLINLDSQRCKFVYDLDQLQERMIEGEIE